MDNGKWFIRYYQNQILIIENNKVVFKSIERKTSYIKPILKHTTLKNKIITFDLETRLIKNVMSPYCISFF